MNIEPDPSWERRLDRLLKGLPDLPAPDSLAGGVMARLEQRAPQPWFRQAWPAWPRPARILSLLGMLMLFGVVCFAGWRVSHGEEARMAAQRLVGGFANVNLAWNTVSALLGALVLAVKKLGNGFLLGCLVIALCNYLLCVGLGTVAVRFALARIRRNQSQL